MIPSKYIEVDSSYRDRKQFPLPSNFDIVISQSGQKGKTEALDPVSDSAPILTFNNSFVYNTNAVKINAFTVVLPDSATTILSPTDPTIIMVKTTGQLRNVVDFYVGATLVLDTGGTKNYRRVTAYRFLNIQNESGTDYYYGLFTVTIPFSTTLGTTGFIINPTPLNTSLALPRPGETDFWIPTGSFINNFYINYYLHNLENNTFRKIVAYDGDTRLASLETPTTTNWISNYNFAIRKEMPTVIGRGVLAAGTTSSITSSAVVYGSLSSISNFYVGDFIRFTTPNGVSATTAQGLALPFGEQRRISAFNPATNTITFSPPIDVSAVAVALDTGNIGYEIEPFSRDNFSPFNYTGSMVSSQQQVCYEVELLNLVIPNFLLKSGRGGRTAFYPYLYVEFYPISDTATSTKGILYSNNPNAYKMLFRAIISDTQQPLITAFVKIGGDGQVHTMKFKPNDSFHFAVYNSDGELLQFSQSDNYSPVSPNPLVQISAIFALKRV
jgi:hypothetical protein